MGYSHCWKILHTAPYELPDSTYHAIERELVGAWDAGVIQYEHDNADPPVIRPEKIRFNGIGDEAHETFLFKLAPDAEWVYKPDDARVFDSCKTGRDRYDFIVCVTLALLKDGLGDSVVIHTDGDGPGSDDDEWTPVQSYLRDHYGIDIRVSSSGELSTGRILEEAYV